MYVVLYDAIVQKGADNVDHGIRGYYYGENGEHSWYDISKAIGRAMVELGLSKSDEPTTFTDEELEKYFGSVVCPYTPSVSLLTVADSCSQEMGNYWGSNSRARANHSRSLGWKPKYTSADMIASIKPEVEAILKQQQQK